MFQMLEADVFKVKLFGLHRVFRLEDLPVKMVLLLHDGIWFIYPAKAGTIARVSDAIIKIMENSVRFSVPLVVDFES